MSKTTMFLAIPKHQVFIISGSLLPETKISICERRIRNQVLENGVAPSEGIYLNNSSDSVTYQETIGTIIGFHGSFIDYDDQEDYLESYTTEYRKTHEKLKADDQFNYSIVCNGHRFGESKLKKIIEKTNKEIYILVPQSHLKEVYKTLLHFTPWPINWNDLQSFTENILANEFFGSLSLNMWRSEKTQNSIKSFLLKI